MRRALFSLLVSVAHFAGKKEFCFIRMQCNGLENFLLNPFTSSTRTWSPSAPINFMVQKGLERFLSGLRFCQTPFYSEVATKMSVAQGLKIWRASSVLQPLRSDLFVNRCLTPKK